MRILTERNTELLHSMIDKLQNDPDKYERIFAAKFLSKYNFNKENSREYLLDALNTETDSEVILSIKELIQKMDQEK